MTNFIQGGAVFNGKQTKGNLKKLIDEAPETVILYDTSAVTASKFSGTAKDLPFDTHFNVVGPDPYTKRDWYATVKHGRGGKLTCA